MAGYVVRGRDDRIVLACWGTDSPDEARLWEEDGYTVTEIDEAFLDTVTPDRRSA